MSIQEFVRRYGLAVSIVLGLVLVVALLPGNANRRTAQELELGGGSGGGGAAGTDGGAGLDAASGVDGGGAGSGEAAGGAGATGTGAAAASGAGGTAAGAAGGGGARGAGGPGDVVFGQGPCRPDGRQQGISRYMPPCVKWTGTDNGGATFRGVTKDKILVIRYLSQLDPGTQAILEGAKLADSKEAIKRSFEGLVRYSNLHYETYGRQVVLQDYNASGPAESDEAMRADALKIAREFKAFAVLDGNPAAPIPNVLARELAQQGVICVCTTSNSSEFYNELPPLIVPYSLPTVSDYAAHTGEYIGKKLVGKKAQFAGDELNPTQGFRDKERKFGLIYLEGSRGKVDPEGRRARDSMVRELGKRGVRLTKEVGYIYDPGRNQSDVSNLVAQMKGAGVTTIIPVWDPLYPILITKEATRQQYFPEWFVVGTGLSDTNTGGRLYDSLQWRHAFGISPLWVTWETVAASPGFREYHHGFPGSPAGSEGVLVNVYRPRVQSLFRGIHLAGPKLTNDTFVRGSLSFPRTGGTPGAPLIFTTRQSPTDIKDFTEVWWDFDRRGPDERGEQGEGLMMRANGGKRYQLGQWTAEPAKAFVDAGAIAISDNPPGGMDPPHEQDRHSHPANQRCRSCA